MRCSHLLTPLLEAQEVHIYTHLRGDPDSASAFALAEALRQLGKVVSVAHDLPEYLDWLIPEFPYTSTHSPHALKVAVDTGNYARLAFAQPILERISQQILRYGSESSIPTDDLWSIESIDVVIDHHESNRGYGKINWVVPEASSTAELLTELIQELEQVTGRTLFSKEVCRQLYTGIISDTQWFKRDVTAHTYAMASMLEQRALIDKVALYEQLEQRSISYFRMGEMLRANFKQYDDVLVSFLDLPTISQLGISSEEAAQTMEELERLPGRIFLLFIELPSGDIRVRLRGKGIPILPLAKQFDGGGHEFRAGATIHSFSQMEDVITAAKHVLTEAISV
ncbi:DHH family phosphoesterase [Sulfoacidibacillus ferrooxidans]|uniref:Bifunctional oligoribonuclease and PAP phosphatase NrnA n=1 Tax=Sulfoacidibacillus ferrooxidans TaxID=2005001 RepID=A0A9X1V9E1_9BACL|nr:DHH family phosphoesterase [Sulfoacidibacillus ferrooxidans]MCI0182533.1 Bifunctional oligoribonuclease and PAP phosphatase NrnA [Sulfoacidibacillus ferrooxidans]